MRTLIKTAGRTGSHVVAQQEMARLGVGHLYHNHDMPLEQLYALDGPCVVHDHTRIIPPDSDRWNLIVSVRRNVYDQAVSFCVAKSINNFGHAPAPDSEFIVDPDQFLISLKNFKVTNYYWLLLAEIYRWHSVRIIYWEDLLPLDREYTLNYPAVDRSRVVNHTDLQPLAQRYIDNHNWALETACEQLEDYLGINYRISVDRARQLVLGA